jgi:hypothetical protein
LKRLFFPLNVALLTFAFGVGLTKVVRLETSRPAERLTDARQTDNVTLPELTSVEPDEEVIDFEAGFIDGDKLLHEGYEVVRSESKDGRDSSAIIKKNGRLIDSLNSGGMGKDSTKFGVFSLLGDETKQLVVMQYTGGAHCCWTYKVYGFWPKLHVIFDDGKYGEALGYELRAEDIDADGRYELFQAVMTFDYFHMSHASSVFPTAVFAYDEKSRQYMPANKKFSHRLLRNLTEDMETLVSARATVNVESTLNETYVSAVFEVLLKRIYAGQEQQGWKFFDKEYQLSDKKELKRDIKQALQGDPIYRSIYSP